LKKNLGVSYGTHLLGVQVQMMPQNNAMHQNAPGMMEAQQQVPQKYEWQK
jgi:hypothetical protein